MILFEKSTFFNQDIGWRLIKTFYFASPSGNNLYPYSLNCYLRNAFKKVRLFSQLLDLFEIFYTFVRFNLSKLSTYSVHVSTSSANILFIPSEKSAAKKTWILKSIEQLEHSTSKATIVAFIEFYQYSIVPCCCMIKVSSVPINFPINLGEKIISGHYICILQVKYFNRSTWE